MGSLHLTLQKIRSSPRMNSKVCMVCWVLVILSWNIHFTPHFSSQFSFLTLFNFFCIFLVVAIFTHITSHIGKKNLQLLIMLEILTKITKKNFFPLTQF